MIRPDVIQELNRLLEVQNQLGYKRGWVWHQISKAFTHFSELELKYIADALGYQKGWVWHQLQHQGQEQKQKSYQPPSQLLKYLNLLNLDFPYNLTELKTSYRKRALHFHPDRGGSHTDFLLLKESYEKLKSYLQEKGVA